MFLTKGSFSISDPNIYIYTVKPVYNGHPWDPQKAAVVYRWPLCRGFSMKIAMYLGLAGFRPAVVDRWPLFRGGC